MTLPGTPRTIDGTRYYITDSGAQIIADTWDKVFLPAHGIAMSKKKNEKGHNPDKGKLWMKGVKSY